MNETDPSYRLFNEVNRKQFYSIIYLTRIVASINKLAVAIDNLKADDLKTDVDMKKLATELSTIQKIFKRRPSDAIALHFDLITNVVWNNSKDYKLTDALEAMCNDLKNNNTDKDILNESDRTKVQICAKNYKLIYGAVEDVVVDLEDARKSLLNLVNVLQSGEDANITDIAKYLNHR